MGNDGCPIGNFSRTRRVAFSTAVKGKLYNKSVPAALPTSDKQYLPLELALRDAIILHL